MEDLETRAWVCQAVVLPITAWEDAEWECEERGGRGRGRRWPWRWGCRLLATAREAVELFAPPDGIEVFHNLERERERERQEEEKKSCGFRGYLLSCPKR